jgi:hypothetical protein
VAETYLPAAKLAVALLDYAEALSHSLHDSSSSSSSNASSMSATRKLLDACWEAVFRAVLCLKMMLGECMQSRAAAQSAGAEGAAAQQQTSDALLATWEVKILLSMQLGLYVRHLHIARHGKSPIKLQDPTSAAAAGDSRQQRRQQQRQQQQSCMQVPALHTQLLDCVGMHEHLLAGSRTSDLVSGHLGDCNDKIVMLNMIVLQAVADGTSLGAQRVQPGITARGAAGSSSSSSRGFWADDFLSGLLLAVVELQVRAARGFWDRV